METLFLYLAVKVKSACGSYPQAALPLYVPSTANLFFLYFLLETKAFLRGHITQHQQADQVWDRHKEIKKK